LTLGRIRQQAIDAEQAGIQGRTREEIEAKEQMDPAHLALKRGMRQCRYAAYRVFTRLKFGVAKNLQFLKKLSFKNFLEKASTIVARHLYVYTLVST